MQRSGRGKANPRIPSSARTRRDGTIEQLEHGDIDPSPVPKGKEDPDEGPYAPEHDHVDPDLEPASRSGRPGKSDNEA
jgi:hypothetical protein